MKEIEKLNEEMIVLEKIYLLRAIKRKNKLFKIMKTSYGSFLVCKN